MFSQKYLTKEYLFYILAKLKIVKMVEEKDTRPIILGNLYRVMQCDYISVDRGRFAVSHYTEGSVSHYIKRYESLFKHRVLFTDIDKWSVSIITKLRAECLEFEVHFDPYNQARVQAKLPRFFVQKREPVKPYTGDLKKEDFVEYKPKEIDFSKARLGNSFTLEVEDVDFTKVNETVKDLIDECINKAFTQLQTYIEGNIEEINEKLTGVKADGEFIAPDGQRLLPNCLCTRCGAPLFKSSVEGYSAQCVLCDEDWYSFEVRKVDPKNYEDSYYFNKEYLYRALFNK